MKIKSYLFIVAACVALFGWNQLQAADDIDVQQAQAKVQQGALLLDVREQSEYDEVHAPNATLIPLSELPARMHELASHKDQAIVVMCRSGRRSAKAVKLLQEAGYSKVSNVGGGITAWEHEGLQVVRKQ